MNNRIFNVFTRDYHLIASFDDEILCKTWLGTYAGYHVPAWIGVFPVNETAKAIPMWEPDDFVKHYNL